METTEEIKQHMAKVQSKTEKFLKEAFCIDGDCVFVKDLYVDSRDGNMYKLEDSKRGVFYITISK